MRYTKLDHAAASAVGLTLVEPPARWNTTPREVTPSDARGVIAYAPALDAVICVPCQVDAGPRALDELGSGVRPATNLDMTRLGCCSSCGRDLTGA